MSFVTVDEVRNVIGVNDTSVISDAVIQQAIDFAEDELDRYSNTTYLPKEDDGTATDSSTTTLEDTSKSWLVNNFSGYAVYIYSGTGVGQIREIVSNTADTLTVATWDTDPDTTSKYLITYLNKVTETYDGTGNNTILLNNYPVIQVDSITIDDTSIDIDDIYLYKETGKIILDSTAAVNIFTAPTLSTDKQLIEITYHYGVLPKFKRNKIELPGYIKRFVGIVAGLQAIAYQIGGTYNALSTFSVPNLSGSIGQQYININATADRLLNELDVLKQRIVGSYIVIE